LWGTHWEAQRPSITDNDLLLLLLLLLPGLGPKNQTQYNIKLPSTKTDGAVLNIIADDMLANVSSEW
jgi:hypothetical protein